ncbi:NAD-dependent malic enzyme [Marinitenerispora sediminis]|uniref:NAD-dependent malic enzyme n=1 Tax=Marinitenerispora sediminis TaxID=1931232 RepID=UPI001F40DA8C|nr:NAD-dependent malic enzyme [Marinitenerispora sediminis]
MSSNTRTEPGSTGRGFTPGPDGTLLTPARGTAVIRDPLLNKGSAFTAEERAELGLSGLLPPAVSSIGAQVRRVYEQYRRQPDDLLRNVYLAALRDRNEVLFHRLLADHLTEMLPVVYDPTIGAAIRHYSHEYRRPRGVYLSVDDPEGVDAAFANLGLGADDVDLVVASDGEMILGIGDWGVGGGSDIAAGKLAVYTAAAGIDPARAVPVALDAGTENQGLLDDPCYLGVRHGRVRGRRYDDFVDALVAALTQRFPGALLHWEDFGPSNGRRLLQRYADRLPTFNDDLQGTGAVTLAAVLSAVRITGTPLREQRIAVFGAGTAGVGIADQLRDAMVRDGLDREAATRRIWAVDRQGLLVEGMPDLRDFQVPYARPAAEAGGGSADAPGLGLAEVVARVRPTVLVGTSTAAGAFTEEIVREMASHVERPVVLPLSNPTERIEAMPADLVRWTGGRALVAAGIPVPPVRHGGVAYTIGQANNALVYPGLGLGAVVARARRVTDGMLRAAAEAVADLADLGRPGAALLPPVDDLREISAAVAARVAGQAGREGVARAPVDQADRRVREAMWRPEYQRVRAA